MKLEPLIPYLAKAIRSRRRSLELSYGELAELTGLSAEYIEFIETGDTNFSMKTLSTVATALRIQASELIESAENLADGRDGDGAGREHHDGDGRDGDGDGKKR